MTNKTFSLDELATLATTPRRTVRYYIQIGLLHRPQGEKRGAYYLQSHLDTLLRIKQLSDAGISLERIREVLAGEPPVLPPRAQALGSVEVRSHILIAPGIELQLSPEHVGASPEQIRTLAKRVLAVWQEIKGEHDAT